MVLARQRLFHLDPTFQMKICMLDYHQTPEHHVVGLLTLSIGEFVGYMKISDGDFQRMHAGHTIYTCLFRSHEYDHRYHIMLFRDVSV
jgi:hypothetical protein